MTIRRKRPGRANWRHRSTPWRKEKHRLKEFWLEPGAREAQVEFIKETLLDHLAQEYGVARLPALPTEVLRAQLTDAVKEALSTGSFLAAPDATEVQVDEHPTDRAKLVVTIRTTDPAPLGAAWSDYEPES